MSVTANAQQAARRASNNTGIELLTRAGLAGYGVLHLAIAWIALSIATGHPAAEGDQSGAFKVLAAQPLGKALVWALAVGLVAMAIWQLLEAFVGHQEETGKRRIGERVVSGARAIIYAALAWTAFKVVTGSPASNAHQQQNATAGLLGKPGGQWLVGTAGVVVVVIGLVIAWYGLTKGFERRLRTAQMSATVRQAAVRTGQTGYAAKGVAYAIVGVLLVIAAASSAPTRSTGLDGALRTLAAQPFGVILLLVVAAGFALFGVYCFFQARYRKV